MKTNREYALEALIGEHSNVSDNDKNAIIDNLMAISVKRTTAKISTIGTMF